MIDYHIGADQKIPDFRIKITFLVKVEIASRLGIKYMRGIVGFSTNETILCQWFSSLIVPNAELAETQQRFVKK